MYAGWIAVALLGALRLGAQVPEMPMPAAESQPATEAAPATAPGSPTAPASMPEAAPTPASIPSPTPAPTLTTAPAPAPATAPTPPASAPATPIQVPTPLPPLPSPAAEAPHLRLTWAEADHPSGIYHAKADAKLTVLADNPTPASLLLDGQIAFGLQPAAGAAFEALSVTPIAEAKMAPGERAKIPLAVQFGAVGTYELRWVHGMQTTPVEQPAGLKLRCIFAPRTAGNADESPWLAALPSQAALVPGWIGDYVAQTSVCRLFIDERFSFDAAQNIGLGFGASLGAGQKQIETMLAEVASAKASLVLQVRVPATATADTRTLAAFRLYMREAIKRSRGRLRGIAISPEALGGGTAERAAFQRFYLAGYEAAKSQDKSIIMLGAGSAKATEWLLSGVEGAALQVYVDAVAITDVASQPAVARRALAGKADKLTLWLIPSAESRTATWAPPPAVALAEGALVVAVPPPEVDHGVTEHLLGGAVFFQHVPLGGSESLPYAALFQGDGYAVAAICGLAAGSPADVLYPALAHTHTAVTPLKDDGKPSDPSVEVSDDTHAMRVVDQAGEPVNCRVGDTVYVPIGPGVAYVLAGGLADDLAGSLRPAQVNRMPLVEATAVPTATGVMLKLRNITADEVAGQIRLVAATDDGQSQVFGSVELPALAPGKTTELAVEATGLPTPPRPVIVELTTRTVIQRTAVVVGRSFAYSTR